MGESDYDWYRSVQPTIDRGYTSLSVLVSYDFWPVKTTPALNTFIQNEVINIASYSLQKNYPHPFNPITTVQFNLPKTREVTLMIFNVIGKEVVTLLSNRLSTSSYYYEWSRPAGIASGVYLYRLQAGDPSQSAGQSYVETRKMVLMR